VRGRGGMIYTRRLYMGFDRNLTTSRRRRRRLQLQYKLLCIFGADLLIYLIGNIVRYVGRFLGRIAYLARSLR
jgi:hypothetical protein